MRSTIEMAREAGFDTHTSEVAMNVFFTEEVKRLVELARADEREPLQTEVERLARANAALVVALVVALEDLMEVTGEPPDRNCSCHISPPCPDCIDYGGWREALENADSALALAKATEDQAGPTTGRTSCNTPVFQNLPLNTPEASALKQAMLTAKATGETK